jgi:Fur family transcriptional regulator, ferric uptake regulator
MQSSETARSELRRTRGQDIVLAALRQIQDPISAQALYTRLQEQQHTIGLATVYRSLQALKKVGDVQSRILANGESVYRIVQNDVIAQHCTSQHYLTCLECERSLQLDSCPFQELAMQWRQANSFQIFYHNLEFFGICDVCEQAAS